MTVVAVLAVLAGPPLMECSGSADGIATCLRDKIAGIGLLPPRESAAAPATAQPEAARPDLVAEPARDAPQITLLRAEPDGSLVIAGTAKPGSEVSVFADGAVLGTTSVEDTGDWALVPDDRLPAGTTAIAVGEGGGAAPAGDAFLVTVDPAGVEQPRIMTPGTADGEDQTPSATGGDAQGTGEPGGLDAAAANRTMPPLFADDVVAEVPPPTGIPAVAAAGAPEQAVEDVSELSSETTPETEFGQVPPRAFPAGIVAEIPPPARKPLPVPIFVPGGEPGEQALAADGDEPPAFPATVVAEIPAPVRPPVEEAASPGDSAEPQTGIEIALFDPFVVTPEIPSAARAPERKAEPELAATQPEALVPGTAAPEVSLPTIEAVEIDGELTYFAGTGENGTSIRIYVDGEFAGESPVDGGHWLVEARGMADAASRRVRAEVVVKGAGVGSVEVNVVFDPTEESVAPASAPAVPNEADAPSIAAIVPEIPAPADPGTRAPEVASLPPQADAAAEENPTFVSADAAENLGRNDALAAVAAAAIGEPADTAAVTAEAPETESAADVADAAAALGAADAEAAMAAATPSSSEAAEASLPDPDAPEAASETVDAWRAADAAAALGRRDAGLAVVAREHIAESGGEDAAKQPGRGEAEMAIVKNMPDERDEERRAGGASNIVSDGEAAASSAHAFAGDVGMPDSNVALHGEAFPAPAIPLPIMHLAPVAGLVIPQPVTEVARASAEEKGAIPEASAPIATIRAMPLGDMGPARFASGKAIIRRGDTLWDIAQRVYGAGYKYQTIYRANRDRISRPGRIYPGQVLDIPLVYD